MFSRWVSLGKVLDRVLRRLPVRGGLDLDLDFGFAERC